MVYLMNFQEVDTYIQNFSQKSKRRSCTTNQRMNLNPLSCLLATYVGNESGRADNTFSRSVFMFFRLVVVLRRNFQCVRSYIICVKSIHQYINIIIIDFSPTALFC